MCSLMGELHVTRESRLARELRIQCEASGKHRSLLASLNSVRSPLYAIAAKPALCNKGSPVTLSSSLRAMTDVSHSLHTAFAAPLQVAILE